MRLAALASVLVVAATACGGPEPPDREPSLVGVVEERERDRALVYDGADFECPRTWLWFGDGARFLRETEPGEFERAAPSDVSVGRRVRVWLDPEAPGLASCPPRETVATVVLVD